MRGYMGLFDRIQVLSEFAGLVSLANGRRAGTSALVKKYRVDLRTLYKWDARYAEDVKRLARSPHQEHLRSRALEEELRELKEINARLTQKMWNKQPNLCKLQQNNAFLQEQVAILTDELAALRRLSESRKAQVKVKSVQLQRSRGYQVKYKQAMLEAQAETGRIGTILRQVQSGRRDISSDVTLTAINSP